jgi:hypothetical protein
MQGGTLSRFRPCCVHLKSRFRKTVPSRFACGERWQWVDPTLSKPAFGKGPYQTVQFIGTKASGCPSWPGVTDSIKGRIHWRRPTANLFFRLQLCGGPYIPEKVLTRPRVEHCWIRRLTGPSYRARRSLADRELRDLWGHTDLRLRVLDAVPWAAFTKGEAHF